MRVMPLLALSLVPLLTVPTPARAQEAATPTVTTSASPGAGGPDHCRGSWGRWSTSVSPAVVVAGDSATYTVTVRGPLNRAQVGIAVQQLAPDLRLSTWVPTEQSVRGRYPLAEGESVTHTAVFRPTTTATGSWSGATYCGPGPFHGDNFGSGQQTVRVVPRLTLTARREAPRRYVFSGSAGRPDQLLSLYRVDAAGRHVLTAQTRTQQDGTWRLRRSFLGSGRFGFVLRTRGDAGNEPGASAVRPTVVH